MDFETAKELRDELEERYQAASEALRVFPREPNGLTSAVVKLTAEYQTACARYRTAFKQLRRFNLWFIHEFSAQIQAERRKMSEATAHYS